MQTETSPQLPEEKEKENQKKKEKYFVQRHESAHFFLFSNGIDDECSSL
jgi:hypothetical protein